MLKKLMVLGTTAVLATGSAAYAQSIKVNADAKQVDALPKAGKVTISGVVEDIVNDNKLILKDSAGKTIDVNTEAAIKAEEGQTVTVTGEMSSEVAGMGKEINKAVVSTAGISLDGKRGHDLSITGGTN